MGWAAIIALIMPLIEYLFKALVDRWLNKAAKLVGPPGSFASPQVATAALFDKAIEIAPRRARVGLRIAKRIAIARADDVFATAGGAKNIKIVPLTALEKAEYKDAG